MSDITSESDKMLCFIYKQYLDKRKANLAKFKAKRFTMDFYLFDKKLSAWNKDDISDTLLELGRAKYISLYIGGEFDLEDKSIIYMETRFKNGVSELLDFISKFIP